MVLTIWKGSIEKMADNILPEKLTVNYLLNLDVDTFSTLDKAEMKRATQVLGSAANKRIRALEQAGEDSPALEFIKDTRATLFSVAGKNRNQLFKEMREAKQFLQMETSTIRGYNRVKDRSIVEVQKEGIELTREDYNNFWKAWNKLRKESPEMSERKFKYTTLKEIDSLMKQGTTDVEKIFENIYNRKDAIYEQSQEREIPDAFTINVV